MYNYNYPDRYNNLLISEIIQEIAFYLQGNNYLLLTNINFFNAEHLLFLKVFNYFNGFSFKKSNLYLHCSPLFYLKNRKYLKKYKIKTCFLDNYYSKNKINLNDFFYNLLNNISNNKKNELNSFIEKYYKYRPYPFLTDTYHRFYEEVNNESNSN